MSNENTTPVSPVARDFEDFSATINGATNAKKVLLEAGASAPREKLFYVPFEKLEVMEGFNPREETEVYLERIKNYGQNMAEFGFNPAKPLTVIVTDDGRVLITDGHTRYRGAKFAREELGATNLDSLPVIAKEKGTTEEDLNIALVRDNDGEKLTPLGLSVVVKRQVNKFGDTPAEAAKKLGISAKWANQLLVLAAAPGIIRDYISAGVVSATRAIELIEEHGAEEAAKIIADGLNKAKEKGKTRSTKKSQEEGTETVEDRQEKMRQKLGADALRLVEVLFQRGDDGEFDLSLLPKDIHDRWEHMVSTIEGLAEE